MPLALNVAATAAASTSSEKSTVPTTCDRNSGSLTNGVANFDAAAQEYSRSDESAVRLTAQSRPPLPSSQSICSASRINVTIAGVLFVWFLVLFLTAIGKDKKSGTQRPAAAIASIRASAAGERSAIHSPPSPAKF